METVASTENPKTLRAALEGISGKIGDEFFRALVRSLAAALEVEYAFVAVRTGPDTPLMRNLACWMHGSYGEMAEVDPTGTPCADVVSGETIFCSSGLTDDYPRVAELLGENVESYIGLPIFGSDGQVLGRLCAFDTKVMLPQDENEWILRHFAARAGAEIERKSLEEKVLQAQKLESLGVLAGGIAHDFNNLLTAMLGNASLALDKVPVGAEARGHLQKIEAAAKRAADLTQQLLAYAGKGQFFVAAVDLNALIWDLRPLLETAVSAKTSLEFHMAHALPSVTADATQVRQIVMNLVANASDALEGESGTVTVVTGVIRPEAADLRNAPVNELPDEGECVFMEVRDTGVGMDRDTSRRIFDPFFTTKFTGRGLGLAAVLGIVRGHKGAIKVTSEPGVGSSLRVLFPSSDAPADAQRSVQDKAAAWKGEGVALVIDDEPSVGDVSASMLKKCGFEPLITGGGLQGIEAYRDRHQEITVVLLDLTMPDMDGVAVFDELKRIDPDVKVILMSGYPEENAKEHFIAGGLRGFLQKPFMPDDFRRALRNALA